MAITLSMRSNVKGKANSGLLSRLKVLINRFDHTLAKEGLEAPLYPEIASHLEAQQVMLGFNDELGYVDMSKWRKVNSKILGITNSMISLPTWNVLNILKNKGFETYLVGGCVRDLLLNRTPKDFDVITTAKLKQIKKQFHRSYIVGQRFPICMVHIKGTVIEVSSFDTVAKHDEEKEKFLSLQMPKDCNEKDFIRWRNSMCRDFTINSLFFDPFAKKIYDYANGMVDLSSLKLRTLIPAQLSFREDCARILRGLRIAARLGLSLSKDTETAIHDLSSSVQSLGKSRIMMELNYMFSYGAAKPSLCLLQRFNLLEILLPFHKLFSHLDNLVTCDRPSDCSLWVGLLAFHLALVNNPQEAIVIWAFASALYHGNWEEGVKFAKEHAEMHVDFVPEILGSSNIKSDEELAKEVTLLASLVQDSMSTLAETESLFKSMSRYPFSPCSGFVFISNKVEKDVLEIFQVLVDDIESYNNGREFFEIDYHLLGKGNLHEARFVLGKIILETMSGEVVNEERKVVKEGRTEVQPDISEENCDLELSDLVKVAFKDGNCKLGLSTSDPEVKQTVVKKQKLVEKFSRPEQLGATMNSGVVEKVNFHKMANKHNKIIETCWLPQEETKMMQGIMSEKENYHLQEQQVTLEMQEGVENDKYKNNERHLKTLEKVKRRLSQDEVTKKHVKNVVDKCSSSWEAKLKHRKVLEKKESHFSHQEVVREKHDKELVKEKGSRPLLSSLFK
ncbi:poly(a) polymerase i [Quercus suber]|uniref:Poly(A) polymerase i n=1 Tax=Quercus suber TaxID=58331 RepID=A0AAW0LQJ9_QUESU